MIITDISISGATTDMKKIIAILANCFAAQISKLIIVKERKYIYLIQTYKVDMIMNANLKKRNGS